MNLFKKILQKRYRVSNLYVVELAKVTEIKKSGWRTQGHTCYVRIPGMFVSQKSLDDEYKLISKNIKVYAEHEDVEFVGDFFIKTRTPLSIYTNKKYISKSNLVEMEKYLNKECLINKEECKIQK